MNRHFLPLSLSIFLASCGGSGGGGSSTPTQQAETLQGVFLDSPVAGLAYSTVTQSGITDAQGTFTYQLGEEVRFSLGDIQIGSATGAAEVTPLDLVGAASFDETNLEQRQELNNILIFLQSFDADRNPDNGIDLQSLNDALVGETLDFSMPEAEFTAGRYLGLLAENQGFLVDENQALNHFLESTQTRVSVSLPVLREQDTNGDGITDIETVYTYNADGLPELVTTTNFSSSPIAVVEDIYEYDANGRLVRTLINPWFRDFSFDDFPINQQPAETIYDYNELGQLVTINRNPESDLPASITRTYDDFGRLITEEKRETFDGSLFFNVGIDLDAPFIGPVVGEIQSPPAPFFFPDLTQAPTGPGGYQFVQMRSYSYSSEGYVASIEQIDALLQQGGTERQTINEKVLNYDAAGRLISATSSMGEREESTLFSFDQYGRLESCSVSRNGTLRVEVQNSFETVNEELLQYSYIGFCSVLTRSVSSFSEGGLLESVESSSIVIPDSFFFFEATTNLVTYTYEGDRLISIQLDLDTEDEFVEQTTELGDSFLLTTSQATRNSPVATDRVSFEILEFDQLPSEQITLSGVLSTFSLP